MKIVLISGDYLPNPGGIAELTHNLARALHKEKMLEAVVTFKPILSEIDYPVISLPQNLGRNGKVLHGDSIAIIRKWNSFLIYRRYFHWLKKTLRNMESANNPLFLIMEAWSIESEYAFKALKNDKIKIGFFLHGAEIHLRNSESKFQKFINRADILVFNSQATKKLYSRHFQVKKQLLILYPGLDTTRLDQLNECQPANFPIIAKETLILSSICRHIPRKGLDIAIKAVGSLVENVGVKDFVFIIAGIGPETDYLKKLAGKLRDNVFFLGSISDEEKKYLLNASDVFIMPNHTDGGRDFEGFGIVFMEAAYFGAVCIAGRSGGAVEAVVDGITGFTIDAERQDSVEKIAYVMRHLLDNSVVRLRLAEEGQRRVKEAFGMNHLAKKFIVEINNMVGK